MAHFLKGVHFHIKLPAGFSRLVGISCSQARVMSLKALLLSVFAARNDFRSLAGRLTKPSGNLDVLKSKMWNVQQVDDTDFQGSCTVRALVQQSTVKASGQ